MSGAKSATALHDAERAAPDEAAAKMPWLHLGYACLIGKIRKRALTPI
jgi:hypothetical protein